jgi:uncharacterized protein
MMEWLESMATRRLPGLTRDRPPEGTVRVRDLRSIGIDDRRRFLVNWESGGWAVTDQGGEAVIRNLEGRRSSDVPAEALVALWRRGLVDVGEHTPFSEPQFLSDLQAWREYYTLVYLLSPGCNLACTYCYLGHHSPRRSEQMKLDIALSRFEEAIALGHRAIMVDFGEFSVATDLFPTLLRLFREKGRRAGIECWFAAQTNGTTIDRALCEDIAGDDLLLSFSVDGPAHIHDAVRMFRNGGGSHALAEAAIVMAQGAGIRTNIICTVARHNIDSPDDVMEEVLRLRPDRYLVKPVLAHGEASERWEAIGVTPSEYATFTRRAWDVAWTGQRPLDQTSVKFFQRLCGSPPGWRDACTSRWCGSGRDLHVVDANDELHACPRFVSLPQSGGKNVHFTKKRRPSLADDLVDVGLRHPHETCEGCGWYRSCGGGCTLAGGMAARDENCESYQVVLERLATRLLPRLMYGTGNDSAASLGLAKVSVRLPQWSEV